MMEAQPTPDRQPTSPEPIYLTPRETKVLRLLCLGHTAARVAEILRTRKRSIDFHSQNIHKKLGCTNTVQCYNAAMLLGFVESPAVTNDKARLAEAETRIANQCKRLAELESANDQLRKLVARIRPSQPEAIR